jgi:hypothetical protein
MKLISHRGNLNGPATKTENTVDQITYALNLGFDVEIDVWYIDNEIYLGHDNPQHKTTVDFIQQPGLWCHAKHLPALEFMLQNNVHCFWHENDERTLTSKGYIWTYPDKQVSKSSVIVVLKKELEITNTDIVGVCGDYVSEWKQTHSNLF